MLWTVDAHCHWSDPRLIDEAVKRIPALVKQGVVGFQLGGVDPGDWARQDWLHAKFPERIWRSFGLHPYYVAAAANADLDDALSRLRDRAERVEALGEMGLDFRSQFLASGKSKQLEWLHRQLDLASSFNKPVVLHIVRAHEEALKELKIYKLTGMIHAFSQGPTLAKKYLDLGYHLSVGATLLRGGDVVESVTQMPLERLLLESDCPDQPPEGQETHDSATVLKIAEKVAELKKLPLERVMEQTRRNLFQLIGKDVRP